MKKTIAIFTLIVLILCVFSTYVSVFAADEDITWTDFSNAKCEIEYGSAGMDKLSFTDVNLNNNSHYYYYITKDNTTRPEFDIDEKEDNHEFFSTINPYIYLSDNLELNQDCYLWVVEHRFYASNINNYKFVIEGKKIERNGYNKDNALFKYLYMAYDKDEILLQNIAWGNHTRKINLKIGKVSDSTILNNIKNKSNNAFSDLMNYAKTSTSTVYNNQVVSSKDSSSYLKGYETTSNYDGTTIEIPMSSLENGYYYVYISLDDENGKYYPVEGVTIAQTTVLKNRNTWSMFGYGFDDFSWDDTSGDSSSNDDLDPENYINLPSMVSYSGDNNETTSKITVSNKVSNYSLYYQYAMMDVATYTRYSTLINELKQDKENIDRLKTDYQNKQRKDAHSSETESALAAYEKAIDDYNAKFRTLQNLLPKYNDSAWVETKDGSLGNLSFLNNYSKTDNIAFVIWAKLKVGDNTYYDYAVYSVNGTKISDSSESNASNIVPINDSTVSTNTLPAGDTTTAKNILPHAGYNTILIVTIIGASIMAIVSLIRYLSLCKK